MYIYTGCPAKLNEFVWKEWEGSSTVESPLFDERTMRLRRPRQRWRDHRTDVHSTGRKDPIL